MGRLRDLGRSRQRRRRTPIQGFFINGWQDGWLPNIEKTIAPPSSVYDLLNVTWNDDMTLSKRHGWTDISTHVTDLAEAEFVIAPRIHTQVGLFPQYTQQVLYFNDSDGEMFVQSLGELWLEYQSPASGGDFVSSGHSPGFSSDAAVNRFRVYPLAWATFEDKIYISSLRVGGFSPATNKADTSSAGLWATVDSSADGHSIPIIYDVTNGTYDRSEINDLDGVSGGIPGARVMLSKYARLFAANVYKGGIYRYPSRIYWSGDDSAATMDPELWDSLNYIDVGADDGQEIVSMVSFGDQILIFKNQSIWTLVGTDDTTFALYQLDDRLGVEGTFAVAASNNLCYFLDERTGVWAYNGSEFQEVGLPINDKLLEELNRAAAYKVNMTLHDNILYVSIPLGAESTADVSVTYVYDITLQKWSRHDYGIIPSAFPFYSDLNITGPTVSLVNNLFGGRATTGLFMFDDALNDGGAAISSYVTTPWFNPGEVGDRHRLRRIEIVGDEGDAAVTVGLYRDLSSTVKKTITYNPAAGTENSLIEDMTTDDFFWTYLSLKFSQNGDDEDMNLFGVGLQISDRRSPRGVFTGTGYSS